MGKDPAEDDDATRRSELASGAMSHAHSRETDDGLIETSSAAIARSKRLLERAKVPYLMIKQIIQR